MLLFEQPLRFGRTQTMRCYLLVRTVIIPLLIPLKKTGAEAPVKLPKNPMIVLGAQKPQSILLFRMQWMQDPHQ